ncbi:SDR family NAD(P)-dependent oxidoreductase [Castellaniella sp.]|uniref:SDR family NAD(P)-dependent oxidoreductase n=1 Tax=Castellaniella sp. TaxID=1955812 RepID=UPI002AFF4E74|nr:SDR family NAD(P)-dependent oxidoreductase [Castellaniella sp.]
MNSYHHTAVPAISADAVAIVGLAFRFPGQVHDEASFWQALLDKRDLVTQIPPDRWATDELQHPKRAEPGRSITFSAGVLDHIEQFDAEFFGISPREATWMDPQQRLLLELSWEAFEHANILPARMAGTDCAVYVGISGLDYGTRSLDDLASLTANMMTGNTLSIAANRLSYFYDLHGPSLAVDTACSSSLVALHHACRALQTGEASSALAGGVNLLLHPYPFIGFTKASMLSATGRCRPFDAAADGYVRAEGGAVLLLKLHAQALADGDTIHAVILASGVNADGGRKTGITIPSMAGQVDLMQSVLARSGLNPHQVDFIEAHGTGTVVGDPIEAHAIAQVYAQGRNQPLPIGSVKANLGHMESASGMAGLVKTILALKHQAVPGLLHLDTPNPQIDFAHLNLSLPQQCTAVAGHPGQPLRAGVNSFGFGGANAHVLLQAGPVAPGRRIGPDVASDESIGACASLPPLLLTAHTEDALRARAAQFARLLDGLDAGQYAQYAQAAAAHRQPLTKRMLLRVASPDQATALLEQYADGHTPSGLLTEDALPEAGPLAFIYSGNGAQWHGMACQLLQSSPQFATLLSDLDRAMLPHAGFSVLALLQALQADPTDPRLDDTTVAQPLLFALQVAQTLWLRQQGILPFAVAGHSVGEIAAAWASGILSLDQAIQVICARSQAQGLTRGQGRMAAVALSVSQLQAYLQTLGQDADEIEIAGYNSPTNLTLSGSLESLQRLQNQVQVDGVFFRILDLDYAFHSRHMDPVRSQLIQSLADLLPSQPTLCHYVSTVSGQQLIKTRLDADYWWQNVREPVLFEQAVQSLAQLGCRVFAEIGPNAILQRYLQQSLDAIPQVARVLGLARRSNDGLDALQRAADRLYLWGLNQHPVPVNSADLIQPNAAQSSDMAVPIPRLALPPYPWQHRPYWHPATTEGLRSFKRRRIHPLLGWPLPDTPTTWENVLDPCILPWLVDHQVGGAIVFPGAGFAEMALAAGQQWLDAPCVLESLDILAPLVFDGEHARSLRLEIHDRDGSLRIGSRLRLSQDDWTWHAVGRLLQSSSHAPLPLATDAGLDLAPASCQIGHAEHYRLTQALGLHYGPVFQGLHAVQVSGDSLWADIVVPSALQTLGYGLHPGLLDLCFQSLVDFFQADIQAGHGVALLPVRIGRLQCHGQGLPARLQARIQRRSARSVLADFDLLQADGQLLASARACRFRAAHLGTHGPIPLWAVQPWLLPHPGQSHPAPVVDGLLDSPVAALAACQDQRQAWFTQALPLADVLVLTFAYQALQALAQQSPAHWLQAIDDPQACPQARWLGSLLRQQGLLLPQGEGWVLAQQHDLPAAQDLWQSLLQDFPTLMPLLTLLGRWGLSLPGLLSGQQAPLVLADQLRHAPMLESSGHDDPSRLGLRLALDAILQRLAQALSTGQCLRVLEIAAGTSELPHVLAACLPADRYQYCLAVPDEALQARLEAEYQSQIAVQVCHYDRQAVQPLPVGTSTTVDQPAVPSPVYDLIIFHHSLHTLRDPQAALVQAAQQLAPGGQLVLAESHPDWHAHVLSGLDPDWWLPDDPEHPQAPVSPLFPAGAWLPLLIQAGLTDPTPWTESAADGLAVGSYLVLATRPRDCALSPASIQASKPATETPKIGAVQRLVLLCDPASQAWATVLQAQLADQGHQVSLIRDQDVASALQQSQADAAPEHWISLLGWADEPAQAAATSATLLAWVQPLLALNPAPRLWLVTRGGATATHDLPTAWMARPAQAALWGLGRVLMNEAPQLACTLIDLGADASQETTDAGSTLPQVQQLLQEILQPDGASEIIRLAQSRHTLVLQKVSGLTVPGRGSTGSHGVLPSAQNTGPASGAAQYRLDFLQPGKLGNLIWQSQPARPLGPQQIELRTQAVGLNFRDVMYLMGLLPDEAVEHGFAGASLGLECAGIITRVGADVHDLQPGDAVMGFGASCFASHVVTRADAVARMPEAWSFEAAATVPTVFFTVYYALVHLARIQPGEHILIHGAAGGVGIAAIQLARHLGAIIHTTAGTPEKRDFARLLGADHVYDSRRLDFADEIRTATQGQGVDVVLNSLAGEAMRRSLDLVSPFGRFLELGKRDFFENTPLGLRPMRNNISYFGIDADQLLTARPALAASLFSQVMALFHQQVLSPLPYCSFAPDRVVDAFRTMQQSRHIGKIVLRLGDAPPARQPARAAQGLPACATQGAWLVSGGISGFGLETAHWLAGQGVRHLVLAGRRGPDTPGAAQALQQLTAQGVQARAVACDLTDPDAVQALVKRMGQDSPPLAGIVHAAAVFDDRLVSQMDAASLQKVLDAKLLGAWHLHQASLDIPLHYFVLFGSVTSAIGNPGQANYVAANAGLTSLAALRRQQGLPATCLAWGPIGDAGYLTRHQAVRDSLQQRLGRAPLTAAQALTQLGLALQQPQASAIVAPFDWDTLARLLPSANSLRFSILNRGRRNSDTDTQDIHSLLQGKSPEDCVRLVQDLVAAEVAQTLSLPVQRLDIHRPLHDLGMDSLMAVELAVGLEQRFGIQLPVMLLNDAPTISGVAARILDRLMGQGAGDDDPPVPSGPDQAMVANVMGQHASKLNSDELRAVADAAQALARTGASLIP